jgi:genome maintenance exonuclease 1
MATIEALGKTENINGRRYYNVDEGVKYPSVTTIIGEMTDKSFLDKWRQRIGHDKADAISKFSANRGTIMHQLCEYYILSIESTPKEKLQQALRLILDFVETEGFTDEEYRVGRSLFFNFYTGGLLNRVTDVISVEEMLYSHQMGGFAGRVDNIYRNKEGRPVILDFKSSTKPKKRAWVDNYFLQIAAYFIAYWEMYGERPDYGEIWISNEQEGFPQQFIVSYDDVKTYGKQFLQYVKEFHQKIKLV